jgi:sodium transport system permease protein
MRNIAVVYRKEMIDSLRDRRTVISMIVVPILLIPLLAIGFGSLAGIQISRVERMVPKVAIAGEEYGPDLAAALRSSDELEIVEEEDYESAIKEKRINAAVEIPADFRESLTRGASAGVKILYDKTQIKSESGGRRAARIVSSYGDSVRTSRLTAKGLSDEFVKPVVVERVSVAPRERVGGMIAGMMLPYLILILAMTGAMYPAIDLTAGEKERGTIETLLLSSATRFELVMGKFFAVFSASFVTVLLASVSMLLTLKGGIGALSRVGEEISLGISPVSLLIVFFMMIPVCLFFSAVLIGIALFAKSYKEATSYLSPLLTILIIPAVVSILPGTEMGPKISLVPILNTSLAFKDLLMGTIDWHYLVIVFSVNVVLAFLALLWAVKLFNTESVLFRG